MNLRVFYLTRWGLSDGYDREATAPLKGRVFKIPKKSRLVERRQLPL